MSVNKRLSNSHGKWLALTGGVGGAKLVYGLSKVLSGEQLTVVVNTADDFRHLGLSISPDLDTLLYHLTERENPEQGWGLADESWHVMAALSELGGEDWFRLGDKDLATHLFRTQALGQGMRLSEVTERLFSDGGIDATVIPMTDDRVSTMVRLNDLSVNEELTFQDYFVKHQCQPEISGIRFSGIESARPQAQLIAALEDPALEGVIICPSNPFVSIDPILSLNGIRERLVALNKPVVAVSPIIGGKALKGPAAKMMAELGLSASASTVMSHYLEFLDFFVMDETDDEVVEIPHGSNCKVIPLQTIMRNAQDKIALAEAVLDTLNG